MLGTYVLSAGYYDAYYLKAQKVRALILKDFTEAFQQVDAMVTPVSPFPAFKLGEKLQDPMEMYLSDIYTITGDLGGYPLHERSVRQDRRRASRRDADSDQALRRGRHVQARRGIRAKRRSTVTMAKAAERGIRIQYDTDRKIRVRNKLHYRLNHWPIWITVFFLVPGPLTFDLIERGFDWRYGVWLGCVLVGTGIAGLARQVFRVVRRLRTSSGLRRTSRIHCTGVYATRSRGGR